MGQSKKGHCRETGNIAYTWRRKTKQKHSTIFVGHHYKYKQTNSEYDSEYV